MLPLQESFQGSGNLNDFVSLLQELNNDQAKLQSLDFSVDQKLFLKSLTYF